MENQEVNNDMGLARELARRKRQTANIINLDQVRKQKEAGKTEEEKDQSRTDHYSKKVDYHSELVKSRLEQRKKKAGKIGTAQAREMVSESSDTLFIMLFIVAGTLDFLNMLDLGSFSTAVNWIGSIIYYVSLAIREFFRVTSSKLSIKGRLRRGMWKKILFPLIELIPGLSLLPAWSGLVLWTYLEAKSRGMAKPKEKKADGYADDYIDIGYQEAA